MAIDRFQFERALLEQGLARVAGLDEAGRGPLAGPVVAAAVVLPARWIRAGLPPELEGLNDSKQLTARERERYFASLTTQPEIEFAIGQADVEIIDAVNILQATFRAMNRALDQLQPPPDHTLVDGLHVSSRRLAQTPLVEGDVRSYSIAAASVIAKVTRDRLMIQYDQLYPAYGFAEHKGYGTPRHLGALGRFGPCPIHRRSFAPVRCAQRELF
ncbi:MAG: ribonuclease HII [Verrucomicrobiota bacterium]